MSGGNSFEQEIRDKVTKWGRVKAMLDSNVPMKDILDKEPWLRNRLP